MPSALSARLRRALTALLPDAPPDAEEAPLDHCGAGDLSEARVQCSTQPWSSHAQKRAGTRHSPPGRRTLRDSCPFQPSAAAAATPTDRAAYLARLRSFKASLWGARPPCAGPVAAARRGWAAVASEPDLVACACCGARCAFPVEKAWSAAQLLVAAEAVAGRLVSAHSAGCSWAVRARDTRLVAY